MHGWIEPEVLRQRHGIFAARRRVSAAGEGGRSPRKQTLLLDLEMGDRETRRLVAQATEQ